ncbi:S-layer homology domain-containing protein [Paenibacillus albiflavus]|nr:S-layer homology domain-containing protein [Paenibacillus albiflavus]
MRIKKLLIMILCLTLVMQWGMVSGVKAASSLDIQVPGDQYVYLDMKPGGTIQLTSIADGVDVTDKTAWNAVNENGKNIADVDASGLVTFTGFNGNVTINASYDDNNKYVTLQVQNPSNTLLSVGIVGMAGSQMIDPYVFTYSNQPVQLALKGNYANGTTGRITSGITWTSTGVASVDGTGLVIFSGKNGVAKIEAKYNSFPVEFVTCDVDLKNTGDLSIQVPGGVFAYSPTPIKLRLFNGASEVTNAAVWTSSNNSVVTVNNGVVNFTNQKSPKVTITANYGGKSSEVTTSVNSVVESIAITTPISYSQNSVQMKLEATYTDNKKVAVPASDIQWSASPASVATIDNSGWITYKNNGDLTVTATYGGRSTSITGKVFNSNVLTSIKINETPSYSSTSVNLTLTGILAGGGSQSIVASEATWSSDNTSVASVNKNTGVVTYTGQYGYVTITASYKGLTASTQRVYIDPSTGIKDLKINELLYYSSSGQQLSLTATLNNGTVQDITASKATWSTNATSIASVDSKGYVRYTGNKGNVTITALYSGKSATISASIDPSIDIYDLRINETLYYSTTAVPLTLTATNRYGNEENIPSSKATWKSSDSTIATVNSSGSVSYTGKEGYVTISATYGNRIATQTEYITTDYNLTALDINEDLFYSPFPMQLSLSGTRYNGSTAVITSSSAVWSSSDTSIATVNSSGVVTYRGKSGNVTIKATYGNRVATKTGYIDANNTIEALNIESDLFYNTSPLTLILTGTLRDGNKQNIPLSSVSWKSSDTNIATVSNGVVTFKGRSGYVTITATYSKLSATVDAYIDTTVTLKQLTINESLAYSNTPVPLSLTGVLSNSTQLTISPVSAVWKSSDTSIATVSTSGVVTYKGKNGNVTITATYANRTAAVSANINTSATLSMLEINESLNYSSSPVTLTLKGKLVNGTTQTISSSSATWQSSNTTIATVKNGVVTFTGKAGYVSISASYGGRAASVATTVNTTTNPDNTNNTNSPFAITVNNKEVETRILNKIRNIKPLYTIPNYSDSGNHWASREIKIAKELELVSGYEDGTFKPNNNVTRGDFAIMIARTFNMPMSGGSYTPFKDVNNHYAKQSIMALYNLGIISGYQDMTFKPDNKITRAEVVTILSQLINFSKVPVTSNVSFNDTNKHWAANQIKQIANAGILSGKGDGKFAPNDNTTRAEAISLLLRTLSLNTNIKNALSSL